MILYGIRNCDTVKKARAWLDQRGVEYRFHDYKVGGMLSLRTIFNTSFKIGDGMRRLRGENGNGHSPS